MRKIYVAILCFCTQMAHGQTITQYIDFNKYISATNNDLVNNFSGVYIFTQSQSNGITGGSVAIPAAGGEPAIYRRMLKLSTDTTTVSICFKFDSVLFATGLHNDDAVSITFRAPAVTSDSVQFDAWGDRINISTNTGSSGALFPRLSNNHWCQLFTQIVKTPAGMFTAYACAYDLGTTGQSTPILLKERYSTVVNMFAPGDSAILSLHATQRMGAIYLDNFSLSGRVSATGISTEQLAKRVIVPTIIQGNTLRLSSSLGKQLSFHVYAMDGRLVKSGSFTDQAIVDCADLAAGNYTIGLFADGSAVSKRLIKY